MAHHNWTQKLHRTRLLNGMIGIKSDLRFALSLANQIESFPHDTVGEVLHK